MPLPLVITANAAVGKAWAPVATVALGGFAVALTGLFGVLDMVGVPMVPGLSAQARFAVDAGSIVTAVAAAGFLIKPIATADLLVEVRRCLELTKGRG